MTVRASGRAALFAVAGLLICASGPVRANDAEAQAQPPGQAAAVGSATDTSAEPARPARKQAKKSAAKSRKADRHAQATKKPTEDETAKAAEAKHDADSAMPPAVANANAQWPTEAQPANTYNMSAQAGSVLNQMGAQPEQPATASPDESAGNMQVVASDQLNDLDRAAEENKPPLTLAKATLDAPVAATPSVTADNNTPWEQTSLIGKIFIAFGGLLTLASAARMFIA